MYNLAYELSLQIHRLTKKFSFEKRYSLTDQVRRSSRSVCANIGEGYRKRMYPKHFAKKLIDSNGETTETPICPDYAKDLGYLSAADYESLYEQYESVGNMLTVMIGHPEKFLPSTIK